LETIPKIAAAAPNVVAAFFRLEAHRPPKSESVRVSKKQLENQT
jgi:hypothetical protein